jgi:hypothetical protein
MYIPIVFPAQDMIIPQQDRQHRYRQDDLLGQEIDPIGKFNTA